MGIAPAGEVDESGSFRSKLDFYFLYSAVQKIGEWGPQPPSGFLPPSRLFPRFWKAGGVSLSAESDEGSALDPQAF